MVSMLQKMQEVEKTPYMLAIYKDNEHYHLLKHALKHYEARKPTIHLMVGMDKSILGTNPIYYCPYPPLDLLRKYIINPMTIFSSRVIKCPKIIRWAVEEVLNADEITIWSAFNGIYAPQFLSKIEYDDELLALFAMAGVSSKLPISVKEKLTPEQRSLIAICA